MSRPTRLLHSSADCLRALGRSPSGPTLWWAGGRLHHGFTVPGARVEERIVDARGSWFSDPSEWYWKALQGDSPGPWTAYTVMDGSQALAP